MEGLRVSYPVAHELSNLREGVVGMAERTVAYTIEVQGVLGIHPEDWTYEALLAHLNSVADVSVKFTATTEYHPDSVEVTYLESFHE